MHLRHQCARALIGPGPQGVPGDGRYSVLQSTCAVIGLRSRDGSSVSHRSRFSWLNGRVGATVSDPATRRSPARLAVVEMA